MRFSRLASYLEKLEETTSRNLITEILAEVFREAKPGEIGKLCYLLQGRVAPLYEAIEFGVAEKFIIRSIAMAYGVDATEVLKTYKKLGDVSKAAEELHSGTSEHLDVSYVYAQLRLVAETSGFAGEKNRHTCRFTSAHRCIIGTIHYAHPFG